MNNVNVGDRVICVNTKPLTPGGIPPPLKLYEAYIVQGIKTHSCGNVAFDVGLTTMHDLKMCKCGNRYKCHGIDWAGAFRFVKEDELDAALAAEMQEINELVAH